MSTIMERVGSLHAGMQMPSSLMAEQLARVFGTEEDPVNCAFYFKVGACRHGDLCSKRHNRPTSSRTLLLSHMYPATSDGMAIASEEPWCDEMYDRQQEHVEAFYTEIVLQLAEYGEIEEVIVVDNVVEYMLGNVYVKYYHERDAERALVGLTGRFYFGKLIDAEYSPVTDFREARCRAFHETRCSRGGACRFLHIKHIPTAIKRRVARVMYEEHPEYTNPRPKRKQKRERSRSRGHDRGGYGGGYGGYASLADRGSGYGGDRGGGYGGDRGGGYGGDHHRGGGDYHRGGGGGGGAPMLRDR